MGGEGLEKKRERERSDSGSRKKFLLPGKSGFSAIYSTGVPNVYTPYHPRTPTLPPVRVETARCTHGQDRILSSETHYSLLLFRFSPTIISIPFFFPPFLMRYTGRIVYKKKKKKKKGRRRKGRSYRSPPPRSRLL